MAFGVLEDSKCSQPLGTTLLDAIAGTHGASETHVVLKPTPSDDPRDPLRFSRLRKELIFLIIIFGACLTGVIGPLLVPGFGIIAVFFNITLTQVTLLNGSLVMALGVSSYLCGCLSLVFGKRLTYLVTTLIMIGSCIWGSSAQTYNSLLGSRILQGLGMGGFFALAGSASINDIYYIHERGRRVGLWNLAVISSVNIAPVISGYVIVDLSWRWSFGLLAIAFGLLLVLIIVGMPETAFDRTTPSTVSTTPQGPPALPASHQIATFLPAEKTIEMGDPESAEVHVGTSRLHAPRWKRMLGVESVIFGRPSHLLHVLVAPFALLRYPTAIWICAMWSVTFTWVIIQGAVATQIFSAAPYDLSPTEIGNLVGIAPLIGSTLGTVVSGWLCDLLTRSLALRNGGVYEPEFRLWIMIPFIVSFVVGAFGLGMAIDAQLSAISCGVFLAILNFAIGLGCTGIVAYQNDACQHRAGEVFGLSMLVKSGFAFGLTFVFNNYYADVGAKLFFFTWAGLTVGVTLFTIPLYIYGKRLRSWAQRSHVI